MKSVSNTSFWRQVLSLRDHQMMRILPYWISAVLVGFISTGYAKLFTFTSQWINDRFNEMPLSIFLIAPGAFLLGWLLVSRFAPTGGGSGIPQVLAALDLNPATEDRKIDSLLNLKVAGIKILSSICCLLGGGAIGREGPTLQISTSVFHFIGSKTKKFWPDTDYKSWIVAGGAAGIASAFNTPLGGIVYAIEELSSAHFHKFKTTALTAVIISGLISQAVLGSYLYLGYPQVQTTSFDIIPIALLTGILSGSAGGFFGKNLFYFSSFIRTKIKRKFLVPIIMGLGLAVLYRFVDHRAIGPGSDINSDLLSGNADHSNILLILSRYISSLISYLAGCAGGIFAPSLAIGASIGAEIAKFFGSGHQNLIILLGMTGFLTAITHCPFTALVLILEMTDRHSAIFPVMIAALTAQAAAKAIDPVSFYERAKSFYLPKPVEPSPEKQS